MKFLTAAGMKVIPAAWRPSLTPMKDCLEKAGLEILRYWPYGEERFV